MLLRQIVAQAIHESASMDMFSPSNFQSSSEAAMRYIGKFYGMEMNDELEAATKGYISKTINDTLRERRLFYKGD